MLFCSQIGLEISKAELSDAGSYECHLSNDVGKVTGACGVTVHKIFAPPFFSKQLTDVKQGREINISEYNAAGFSRRTTSSPFVRAETAGGGEKS